MPSNSDYLTRLLIRLREFRTAVGLTPAQVEASLILGPGWISAIEEADVHPSLDVIASMLSVYGRSLADLAEGATGSVPHINRSLSAVPVGSDLDIHFSYAKFDAIYRLQKAAEKDFRDVILTLRNGLAQLSGHNVSPEAEKAIKTESVANAFLKAVHIWPHANPSDIWWFIIYRAYCDPYNHPAVHSRLDFTQSWKRTSGWALERVLLRHYGQTLAAHGVNLIIADGERKTRVLAALTLTHRLEADKMDVLLTVNGGDTEKLIGVVHVKASFAERRTDDVPMSHALVQAGYISPLWTMDCKSTPAARPTNKGELGPVLINASKDSRSAKRKDIEDDRFFSACFSYNANTIATPEKQQVAGRIFVCDFSDPDDSFTQFIVSERQRVKAELGI